MPIRVEELYNSRQTQTDGLIKTSEIDYLVSTTVANEILTPDEALYAEGVPKLFFEENYITATPYPGDETMWADSKSVKQRLNCNTYIVNVKFSNNYEFSSSSRNLNESVTFQTNLEEMSLPFCTKDLIVYPPVAAGDIPQPVIRWQTREYKIKATYLDLRISVEFEDLQYNRHISYITSQIGNWHRLGGGTSPTSYWRFLGGNATSKELVPASQSGNIYRGVDGKVWRYSVDYTWRQRKTIRLNGEQFIENGGYNPADVILWTSDISQFNTIYVKPPQSLNGMPTIWSANNFPDRRYEMEHLQLPGFPWRQR